LSLESRVICPRPRHLLLMAAEAPMQIRLTVIDGPHKGKEFTFDAHDTFIVGRAKHAHFRLPIKDKYFSRNHSSNSRSPGSRSIKRPRWHRRRASRLAGAGGSLSIALTVRLGIR